MSEIRINIIFSRFLFVWIPELKITKKLKVVERLFWCQNVFLNYIATIGEDGGGEKKKEKRKKFH